MTTRRAAAVLGILVFAVPVFAESEYGTALCNAAFSQGIRDNWSVFTEQRQFESFQQRVCQARFNSYSSLQDTGAALGVDIPLVDGLLGLTGSFDQKNSRFSQAYERFCSSSFFDSDYHVLYQSRISLISSALTSSWNRCQELHLQAYLQSKGVFLAIAPMEDLDQFVARVVVKDQYVGKVKITALHPDRDVTCYRGQREVVPGKTKIDIKEFSLTCFKDPTKEISFTVETNSGPTQAVVVPAVTSRIEELAGELARLREFARGTADRLAQFESQQADTIRECRLCFQEIEGSSQCQGSRETCSGWSGNPNWTSAFRDDTDGRGGGCTYQWRVECR